MQHAQAAASRPLRVVITSNTLGYGGAEVQRVQLANGLADGGYAVTLVLLQGTGALLDRVSDQVTVLQTSWRHPRPRPRQPAVVVTGTTRTEVAFGAIWRTGRPTRTWLVAAHTAAEPACPTYDRDVALLIRRSDGVIALSAGHWEQLTKFQALHRSTAFLVPNGADLTATDTASPERPRTPVQLVFLGRLVESKGLQVAIAALARLTDRAWTLTVYGDGPYREQLERDTPAAIGDRVRFAGWTSDAQLAVSDADLLLLPSRREAFPMVLLEAMSAGVPAMASSVGAVPEMLADGAGIVVTDDGDWYDALRQVLDHPERLHAMRAVARRRAGHYSLARMIEGYATVLETSTVSRR